MPMNPEIISRVISLIGKNNERVVLVDPDSGRAVVVMDLGAYESLLQSKDSAVVPVTEPPAAVWSRNRSNRFPTGPVRTEGGLPD